MSGKMKLLIGIMLALLLIIAFVNSKKPVPLDWSESYHLKDKIPFGLYVFDQEKHHFFNQEEENVEKIYVDTPYDYFNDMYHEMDEFDEDYEEDDAEVVEAVEEIVEDEEEIVEVEENDSTNTTNKYEFNASDFEIKNFHNDEHILFINKKFITDKQSVQVILDYVKTGKTAFLCATDFHKSLLDSLKIDMLFEFTPETDFEFGFYDKRFKPSACPYNKGTYGHYFSKINHSTSKELGYQLKNNQKKTNFIVVNHGRGQIYLHSQPVVFSNYYMLKSDNHAYLSNLFKTIPPNDWLWFVADQDIENYLAVSQNKLRFIGQHPPLKWAYWLLWLMLILFLVFNSKRKQRIIPVIKPLENTTIDFTKTIANLYYQEKNYKDIIHKKIIYFLEKVRTTYYLDTSKLDEEFMLKLAHKSGRNEDEIKKLINLIVHLKNKGFFEEIDLTNLNKTLEQNNF